MFDVGSYSGTTRTMFQAIAEVFLWNKVVAPIELQWFKDQARKAGFDEMQITLAIETLEQFGLITVSRNYKGWIVPTEKLICQFA